MAAAIHSFQEQKIYTQTYFTKLCRDANLQYVLRGIDSWAIVGGSVRDVMIASRDGAEIRPNWSDIDIALAYYPKKGPLCQPYDYKQGVFISRNHFGGLKAYIPNFGHLDLWVWESHTHRSRSPEYWHKYLESVDFGVNAAAFVWPSCQLVIHQRWQSDICMNRVEKLIMNSPRRELQPFRAVALVTKLELMMHQRMSLGPNALNDLRWLMNDACPDELNRALSYLAAKVTNKRWPQQTLTRLSEICFENGFEIRRTNIIGDILLQYLDSMEDKANDGLAIWV